MTDPIALPTIESQVTAKLDRIDKRLLELEAAANEMADLRVEKKQLQAVLAIYAPKSAAKKKPRARNGKAEEIITAIIADGRSLSDDAVMQIAVEQKDAPSRSALRRALKTVREFATVGES